MIANLFHAPTHTSTAAGDGETTSSSSAASAVGVGTVGSSEAIMLAGLAFKRKWQAKRKAQSKPYHNPNIVTGANVQVHFNFIYVYINNNIINDICSIAGLLGEVLQVF